MADPIFLTLDEALEIHAEQIKQYGGSAGVRDLLLLKSALAQPEATFGGEFLHGDLFEMAAAYLFHITNNHPFVDGNKRAGTEAALLFLRMNGGTLEVDDESLVNMVLDVAQGKLDKSEITQYLRKNCRGS